MGDGVLGVLILHRRSEKNLVALFRLFFFLNSVGSYCPCPYIGFHLLVCLAFQFCGLGFSFFSGPLVFLTLLLCRVQKSLVAFVVWVRPYPFLSRYSSMAYFLFFIFCVRSGSRHMFFPL